MCITCMFTNLMLVLKNAHDLKLRVDANDARRYTAELRFDNRKMCLMHAHVSAGCEFIMASTCDPSSFSPLSWSNYFDASQIIKIKDDVRCNIHMMKLTLTYLM